MRSPHTPRWYRRRVLLTCLRESMTCIAWPFLHCMLATLVASRLHHIQVMTVEVAHGLRLVAGGIPPGRPATGRIGHPAMLQPMQAEARVLGDYLGRDSLPNRPAPR